MDLRSGPFSMPDLFFSKSVEYSQHVYTTPTLLNALAAKNAFGSLACSFLAQLFYIYLNQAGPSPQLVSCSSSETHSFCLCLIIPVYPDYASHSSSSPSQFQSPRASGSLNYDSTFITMPIFFTCSSFYHWSLFTAIVFVWILMGGQWWKQRWLARRTEYGISSACLDDRNRMSTELWSMHAQHTLLLVLRVLPFLLSFFF